MVIFFPPAMSPSVSSNNPRIRPIEKQVLKPVYIIKINDEVDLAMPDATTKQYEDNVNNHSFKKLTASFKFLKLTLDIELSDLPRWATNNGYDDCRV
ncbi:unnamed protein product [Rhizopus stolonifer]